MSGPTTKNVDGADPLLGKIIDERYRIMRQLGEGGIGRVYVAEHVRLDRQVALKTLLTRYGSMPVLQERFSREAQALASLTHPNIVTVTDYGLCEGMPYIVMELLEGEDLAAMLARGEPIEPVRALQMMRQMVLALAYAHDKELVHRDLKPHNVFVRVLGPRDDHVEVLDFGLARFLNDAWKDAPKLTAQGALIGTPAYMAPEQASGEEVDARADVYAAGCVIFETLTGRRVFDGDNPGDMIRAHMLEPPRSLVEADPGLEVDPALEAIVARALEKSRTRRFADGWALLDALDALGPEPIRRIGPRPEPSSAKRATLAPTQAGGRKPPPVTRAQPLPAVSVPIRLPQSPLPLILAGVLGAVLLMGVGAGVVYFMMSPGSEAEASDPVAPPAVVVDAAVLPPPRPPARQPFAGELPEPLRRIYDDLEDGHGDLQAHTRALSVYQGANPSDPRAPLLLARIFVERGIFGQALVRYREAYRADPGVRGDPNMRVGLIRIAREEGQYRSAEALITEAWGRSFVPELDAYLGRERMSRAERGRLVSLRERLNGR